MRYMNCQTLRQECMYEGMRYLLAEPVANECDITVHSIVRSSVHYYGKTIYIQFGDVH